MKILITGGHVSPALAMVEEFKKRKNVHIIFVGRKYATSHDEKPSFEYESIFKKNIKFIELETGRLTRVVSTRTLFDLLKFPVGLINAYKIVKREKPNFILSFGGYLALPTAFAGYLLGIPIFTHEQTLVPGITNRIIGSFAKKVFLAFPETEKYFKKGKVKITGNPLRSSIFKINKKPFEISKVKPVIYIAGGSLGSHSINKHIGKNYKLLLKDFIIIHQTGSSSEFKDYEKFAKIKNKNYFLKTHFFDDEIGYIYNMADIIITRSGANTLFELIALKKPSVQIPLPWASYSEQFKHAEFLKNHGVAEVFAQEEESSKLYNLIIKVYKNRASYEKNFKNLTDYYNEGAAVSMADQISKEI